mmetsp:Transcript_7066/g.10345  ORF Transcript_7066/g.10345 Transcript_7066/m.10345 type:complete len:450 (+) Transcript_7066:29-1378(+)
MTMKQHDKRSRRKRMQKHICSAKKWLFVHTIITLLVLKLCNNNSNAFQFSPLPAQRIHAHRRVGAHSRDAAQSSSKLYERNRVAEVIEIALNATSSDRKVSTASRMKVFSYLSRPTTEVQSASLILLTCALTAINTLQLPPFIPPIIDEAEVLISYIFAIDFFLRWWAAGQFRFRYLLRPLVLIDAAVVVLPLLLLFLAESTDTVTQMMHMQHPIVPSFLSTQRIKENLSNSAILVNLRLLRILRVQRLLLTDRETFARFEQAMGMAPGQLKEYQLRLARVLLSIFILLSVSSGLIYAAEHEVNPQIPDYFAALYFGLTTLTTVGFGDIVPITSQGRFVVSTSILLGITIIPAQAASLVEALLDLQKDRSKNLKREIRLASAPTLTKGGILKERSTVSLPPEKAFTDDDDDDDDNKRDMASIPFKCTFNIELYVMILGCICCCFMVFKI